MPNRRNALYLLSIISLLIGLFTGRAVFFNLTYLVGGLLLLSYVWAWLSVRGITISRKTRSRRAQVGRNFSEIFTITNHAIFPKIWLEIRDYSELPGHRVSHIVPTIKRGEQYTWLTDTPCQVRGEFRLGPISLISGDPFGLYTMSRRISGTTRVIVFPATVSISKFNLPMGILSGGEAERRLTHHVTTNAAGVRDYVTGDSFNRVHWRSTARRDKLMVKEFELDPMVDIWLFVDFSAQSLVEDPTIQRVGQKGTIIPTSQHIPPSTEEYIVVIAASLANYFIETERALGFTAYVPHRQIYQPERGNKQLTRILQTLAVARSTSKYTLGQTLALESTHFARGITLIIVTSSLDPSWIEEAQILSSRGIRPMCVYVDPVTFSQTPLSSENIRGLLQISKIPHLFVHKNDDLSAALSQRPF